MVKFRAEEGLDYGGVARYEFDTKLKAEHEIKTGPVLFLKTSIVNDSSENIIQQKNTSL